MTKPTLTATCLLILFSCTEAAKKGAVPDGKNAVESFATESFQHTGKVGEPTNFREKELGGIHYTVRVMGALELLEHKGQAVAPEDKADLAKETVVLLEIGAPELQKDIWQHPQLQLSEEDAANYLIGDIVSDLTIEQNGHNYSASGSNFEGKNGAKNALRAQIYFAGADSKQPLKVVYYDRLFGAGLVKFGINGL
jgi:hypothetical protein